MLLLTVRDLRMVPLPGTVIPDTYVSLLIILFAIPVFNKFLSSPCSAQNNAHSGKFAHAKSSGQKSGVNHHKNQHLSGIFTIGVLDVNLTDIAVHLRGLKVSMAKDCRHILYVHSPIQ